MKRMSHEEMPSAPQSLESLRLLFKWSGVLKGTRTELQKFCDSANENLAPDETPLTVEELTRGRSDRIVGP